MKKFILPLFLCSMLFVSAQTVTIFDPYNATKQATVDKKPIFNNVQWNFSLLSRGAFALTYERKINDYVGLEGGAGLTYMDPMSLMSVYEVDYSTESGYDYYLESNQQLKGGYFVSGALKIYPKQMEDFEGVYASPVVRYRTYAYTSDIANFSYSVYNETTSSYDTGTALGGLYNQSYRATDMALLIGYQYEGYTEILWNIYAGFGWTRKMYDQATFNPRTKVIENKTTSESMPNLFLGMSLGFTF